MQVKLRGRWLTIERVVDRWRIDDEWWRERSASRMYFECLLESDLRVGFFQDLLSGRWYSQRG